MRLIPLVGIALFAQVAGEAFAVVATVEVQSGRSFEGEILRRTDSQDLWLRIQKGGIAIDRPLRWHRIIAVRINNEQIPPEAFRKRIESSEWHWPATSEHAWRRLWQASDGRLSIGPTLSGESSVSEFSSPAEEVTSDLRIASIRVDAAVDNWNSETAIDGIRLRVTALNQEGQAVPARGTVQAELIGQGPTNGVDGNPFPVLDQWTTIANADESSGNQVELRLPFRGVHPEFGTATHVSSFGMVHAKFFVPGQGTFEDTAAFTRIRPYSPVRDRLEQFYGRRFHPVETATPQMW